MKTSTHTLLQSLVLAMLLPSCGPDRNAFSGSFQGTSMGQRIAAELTQQGGQVTGPVTVGQLRCAFRGKAEGDRLTGSASNPVQGGEVRIEAQLQGDTLHWTAHMPNLMTGGTTAVTVDLQRSTGAAGGESPTASAQGLDPRLVGNWRRTVDYSSRTSPRESFNMATDIHCTLAADGTCRYGGGQTAFSAENRLGTADGETGAAAVTSGRWKTEGQLLFAMPQGGAQWIPMGRFSVSGEALVLYPADGSKAQYWERV